MLRGERVALNLVQRMSGIATLTARYVAAVEGTRARIVDTRKTTPGLRALERHAVLSGGGYNHRFSLSDAILAKDNHLAILAELGSISPPLCAPRATVSHTTHIEVEVDRLDQVEAALAGGPTRSCSTTSRPSSWRRASRSSAAARWSRRAEA